MQCGAKMNMVTFSAFEKQIAIFCIYCINLGLTQVPAVTQVAAKYSPIPSKPLQETPARKPRGPRVNCPAAPASTAETP